MTACHSLGGVIFLGLLATSAAAAPCKDDECTMFPEHLSGEARGLSLMQSGRSVLPVNSKQTAIALDDGLLDEFATMEDEFDDGYAEAYASKGSGLDIQPTHPAPLLNHVCDPHLYIEALLVIIVFALAGRVFKLVFPKRSTATTKAPDAPEAEKTEGDAANRKPIFAGGSTGFAALEQAVRAGDEVRCLEVLKQGGRWAVRQEDPFGCTALHVAAHCGSAAMTRLLLDNAARVDAREGWDETPLHIAARSGSTEVCSVLLEHDADINAVNAGDWTPLLVAGQAEQEATCKLLLAHGAGAGGVEDTAVPPLVNSLLVRRIFEGGTMRPAAEVHTEGIEQHEEETYEDASEPFDDFDG